MHAVTVVSVLTPLVIVTVVEQVIVLHPLLTVHNIVDVPALKLPLASFVDPFLIVDSEIVKPIVKALPQLADATSFGIV